MHPRLDTAASSLLESIRARLLSLGEPHISQDGVAIIKARIFRSLE